MFILTSMQLCKCTLVILWQGGCPAPQAKLSAHADSVVQKLPLHTIIIIFKIRLQIQHTQGTSCVGFQPVHHQQLCHLNNLSGYSKRKSLQVKGSVLHHPSHTTCSCQHPYINCVAFANKYLLLCHYSKSILRRATRPYKVQLIINYSPMVFQLPPIHHRLLDAFNQSASLSYSNVSLFFFFFQIKDDIFIAVTLNFQPLILLVKECHEQLQI